MAKESSSFFIIALVGVALAYVYIMSLGGFKTNSPTVGPAAAGDYRTLARQDAVNAGIDPNLFERQINEESGFNQYAVSNEGAIGIAQFLPSTAAGLGIDPRNPVQSLQGAANLMASYVRKYGDYRHALAAYNAGSSTLEAAMHNCLYYYWCLPSETQRYIDVVMGG